MNTAKMRYFLVTVAKKYPAYNETVGTYRYYAVDRNEAVSMARRDMRNAGHTRHDGPVSYSARLDESQTAECAAYGYDD